MITASKHALQGICTVDIDMAWGVMGLGLGLGLELEGWPYCALTIVQPESSLTAAKHQHSTSQHSSQTIVGCLSLTASRFFFFFSFFFGSEPESHLESESD